MVNMTLAMSKYICRHVVATVAVATIVSLGSLANGSVLTFDAKTTNTTPLPAGYGDNITITKVVSGDAAANTYGLGNGATPNIALDFTPMAPPGTTPPASDGISSFYFYDDGSWPEVAELYTAPPPNDNINVFKLTFTPDAGYSVRINSFDLYDYPNYHNGEDHTLTWRVLDGSNNVLASGGSPGNVPSTVGPTIVPVNAVMASFFAGLVVLELTHSAGFQADLALDNVNFDQQVVPEPSCLCLVAMPAVLLMRRWRSRKAND
jgi:hypothetical protein